MNRVIIASAAKQTHGIATSLAVVFATAMSLLAMTSVIGCSKSSAPTSQSSLPEPDNAMTRYVEGLADDQRRAKLMEERANRAIAKQQNEADQINQATNQ